MWDVGRGTWAGQVGQAAIKDSGPDWGSIGWRRGAGLNLSGAEHSRLGRPRYVPNILASIRTG